ncbi:Calcium/calmodulin-dependent/calcium-dependent protein kinase [Metarhizium album ARSEF 1941]|uniref:Calcium/calmodulin-dependent/calcium-dependent protein kinase n=1 Tax=Metarhizium album (strain ARSEF 1941) TaxID=1081103 RepID=A0A0B2X2N7_METAS|nr:Calcium/calmodulin-dependent/calcium-dependent protein kinase [Metarhizium album ARSEF 1941]KHO00559.1 Calcium/calmodulin-dependent/calcium-dependent protein kinase [Metarhizium album ARSEF 1941]
MSGSGASQVIESLPCNESSGRIYNGSGTQDTGLSTDPSATATGRLVEFHSKTIAPSPPTSHLAFQQHVDDGKQETSSPLRISTGASAPIPIQVSAGHCESHIANMGLSPPQAFDQKASPSNLCPISRTPSIKAAFATYSSSLAGSGGSISSPVIAAMGDLTPLPSPLLSSDSPGPWKKLDASSPPPQLPSIFSNYEVVSKGSVDDITSSQTVRTEASRAAPPRRKQYGSLIEPDKSLAAMPPSEDGQTQRVHHTRNRSVSEYIPEPSPSHRRQVAVSGPHISRNITPDSHESHMRREINFAESRGITSLAGQPPTPPPSESSKEPVDGGRSKDRYHEWFEAWNRHDQKRRRWRSIGFLGQGTFSRVMLASSQILSTDYSQDQPIEASSLVTDKGQRKKLVAIKVCEHGPRGGASEERIEMSLKRELEIMQCIHHPSLVNLKAWSIEPTRAILVLSYCPGGDLFDMATIHRRLFTPALLRRVFSELVGAVTYLHEKKIVHRDIKLENVLVNLTPMELADPSVDWSKFPTSVITLADLGLSRRIADDEKLETRCGSDDYAAPEVIMGQPYDGRATDAWSLGVLLYALLESRLPFDPHPGMSDAHRMRSRTSHRIARVEWRWVEYAGDDGEHEANIAMFEERGLIGAMEITQGLLKRARSRWTMDHVASQLWVKDAIRVQGGIKFRDEDEGQEV